MKFSISPTLLATSVVMASIAESNIARLSGSPLMMLMAERIAVWLAWIARFSCSFTITWSVMSSFRMREFSYILLSTRYRISSLRYRSSRRRLDSCSRPALRDLRIMTFCWLLARASLASSRFASISRRLRMTISLSLCIWPRKRPTCRFISRMLFSKWVMYPFRMAMGSSCTKKPVIQRIALLKAYPVSARILGSNTI